MSRARSQLDHNLSTVSRKIERFISSYISKSSAKGLVIGLSGGLDSSVVLRLSVSAIGPEKVFALIMPSSITPDQDVKDAVELAELLKVRYKVIEVEPIIERYMEVLPDDERARGNLTARIRMSMLYYHAAINGYLVAGTSDRTEREIGFYTKFGDGAADILPIGNLYKMQVRALASFLKIPKAIVGKKSSPRLWRDHLAEEEIGMSYEKLDPILQLLIDGKKKPQEIAKKLKVPLRDVLAVKEMVDKNAHKRNPPLAAEFDAK
jgi:NAD+ synthase